MGESSIFPKESQAKMRLLPRLRATLLIRSTTCSLVSDFVRILRPSYAQRPHFRYSEARASQRRYGSNVTGII